MSFVSFGRLQVLLRASRNTHCSRTCTASSAATSRCCASPRRLRRRTRSGSKADRRSVRARVCRTAWRCCPTATSASPACRRATPASTRARRRTYTVPRRHKDYSPSYVRSLFHLPRAGSEVERIDPLRFLAGCRKRRLNQALVCPVSQPRFLLNICCALN